MCGKCDGKENHIHGKRLFSEIHSCPEKEWEGADIVIPDDGQTAKLRAEYDAKQDFESLTALAGGLCFQLRYTEAKELYVSAMELKPEDYSVHRRLALVHLKLLDFKAAEREFLWCQPRTADEADILYRLGLTRYGLARFDEAEECFKACLPLVKDDGEMFVAALFWYALCLRRENKPIDVIASEYEKFGGNCGHHTGYDAYLKLLLKGLSAEEAVALLSDDTELNLSCLLLGLSVEYSEKDADRAAGYLNELLSLKDVWAGFAYIAGKSR